MRTNVLIAALLLLVSLAQGGGKEVVVAVGWQGAIKGELVMVGDTTLVVAAENNNEKLTVIPIRDIRWVVVKGQDNVSKVAVIGLLSGAVLGGVLGASMADQRPGGFLELSPATKGAIEGAGIGALIGLGIGIGIGNSVSSEEVRISPEDHNFRQVLSKAARYPLGSHLGN